MKAKLLFRIYCLVFSILSLPVSGQEYDFKHYGLTDGLSQSVINCILQDEQGYMWFGTQNGLNRFDGYSFKKFISNPLDSNSLSDNRIFAITEDKDNNLWIGTINGLVRYNKKLNIFKKINFLSREMPHPQFAVNGLTAGKNGEIFVNSKGFLSIIFPGKIQTEHYAVELPIDGSVYDQNRPVIEDNEGNIWLGTESGLCRFNRKLKKFSYFRSEKYSGLIGNDITALFQDRNSNLWVGTSRGLCRLNIKEMEFLFFTSYMVNHSVNNPIRSITEDKSGRIWVATENGGLLNLNTNGNVFSINQFLNSPSNQNSVSHNIIYSLFLDDSDVLWLGTLNGIDKTDLKQKKFRLYRKTTGQNSLDLADNVMASIFKDDDGLIWIGTWGSGLNILNRKTSELKHYSLSFTDYRHIPNDFIHVIFKDRQKRIWVGTRNGLLLFDKKTARFMDYREFLGINTFPSFQNNRIYCMLETFDQRIAIGTANGLHILDLKHNKTESFYSEDSTISGNLIYSVMEDMDHDIWIATTSGLDCYSPLKHEFRHFRKDRNNPRSIVDNFIVSLCISSEGKIWVGTNSGIGTIDKHSGNFTYYPEFPSNIVYDILEDKNKNIWLSSGLGLSKFDNQTKQFINYDTEDGLQSLEFNIKACFKSEDGEIFFGGMNGFNSFYPDSLLKNSYTPNIVISSFEMENKTGKHFIHVDESDEITLTHHDYAFSIEFASLDFTHPEKNKYAYEMLGLSENRIEYGNRRHITFLNLSPGKYEFRVYGTNCDGVWNQKPAVIKINILPPWWKSNIAYVAYFLLFIFLIFLYIKIRERQLKVEKRMLEEKVKERTNEILMQKNEIQSQRDEIEMQKNFVTEQRDHIAQKNQEINDSIIYAKRIQSAVMPSKREFKQHFTDFFIFYQPKDIVSGDFYWIKNKNNKCYFAVADCTGHGVPGAFVSLLGISFLNEIVETSHIESAGDFLDKLRFKMKEALQQTGRRDEAKDGLDISLAILDQSRMNLEFAGANNHGLLYTHEQLIQLNADKMPIGIHGFEKSFETVSVKLNKGDIIYLFTDGYLDQFGENRKRKFLAKNFKLLIETIHHLPLIKQRDRFAQTFSAWKGNLDQIDDVTVLGVLI